MRIPSICCGDPTTSYKYHVPPVPGKYMYVVKLNELCNLSPTGAPTFMWHLRRLNTNKYTHTFM